VNKVFEALKSYKQSADDHQGGMARAIRGAAVSAIEEFETEWLFKPNPQHLKAIADITAAWLVSHGGMANGYCTRVDGVVSTDTDSRLDVILPGHRSRTGDQNLDMGCELYKLVRTYMVDNNFGSNAEITFVSRHIGDGCFSMSTTYTVSHEFTARKVAA
jgi:hypothetical protein